MLKPPPSPVLVLVPPCMASAGMVIGVGENEYPMFRNTPPLSEMASGSPSPLMSMNVVFVPSWLLFPLPDTLAFPAMVSALLLSAPLPLKRLRTLTENDVTGMLPAPRELPLLEDSMPWSLSRISPLNPPRGEVYCTLPSVTISG